MPSPLIKKLFVVALYSSPVIGALTVTPLFIVNHYTNSQYVLSILLMTGFVLGVWAINIWLFLLTKRRKAYSNTMRYLLSYLLGVVCVSILVAWVLEAHQVFGQTKHHVIFHYHAVMFFSIDTVVLILQDLVILRAKNTDIEQENLQLRMKNMEAANNRLKQQVQPHFLFNSLSTLKALIKTDTIKAEEYLVKLSYFLRYAVSSGQVNTVRVEEEVRLCADYLHMQQIRFGEAMQFVVDIPADVQQGGELPVFSLQTLAENAIKHNTFTVQSPLIITLDYKDGWVTVTNNLQPLPGEQPTGGLGLANLAERYKILSGAEIRIHKGNTIFSVSIQVL